MKEIANKLWDIFENDFKKVFDALENCKHQYVEEDGTEIPNPHHGEGSVGKHTRMVFEEAVKRIPSDFPTNKAVCVLVAAICHDWGKIEAREQVIKKDGTKKTRFFGHGVVSANMAVPFICKVSSEFGLNGGDGDDIIKMILLHDAMFQIPTFPSISM